MKTLQQFKQEMGIQDIHLMQGKGRMYAKVKNIDLVVAKETDLKKQLYIIPLTTAEGAIVPDAMLLLNNDNIKIATTI